MGIAVRPVFLADDREEMLELLSRNLPDLPQGGFDWRYRLNPVGLARSWFVYPQNETRAVAMASVIPRKVYADGREMVAGQVMHFVVDANYRSLGPALLLQRATFEAVDSGELDFCYDCPPHDQGMSTFVRLGMRPSCELTRYALLLRSDDYLARRIGTGFWTRPAVLATNIVLRARTSRSPVRGVEVSLYEGRFGEEFSVLDRQVSSVGIVRHRRSMEDLNYRYKDNPEFQHRVLVARRNGELSAFAVFVVESNGIASLVELFGRETSEVGPHLIDALVDQCRRENVSAVCAYCSDTAELKSLLHAVGFRPREKVARVVAYAKSNSSVHHLLSNGIRWSFSRVEWLG
ncbi:MAG TPA: hypothetical protein VKV39_12780 [Candidatus Sulfotelmatobacter sp.]|nr:hypothetical protein [Candidatus Sulfotelmatobacter sp.]